MAKKGTGRDIVRIKSTGTDDNGNKSHEIYSTMKNKRNTTEKLELMKYDKTLRKHVLFKEVK